MRVLITGAGGYIGNALNEVLGKIRHSIVKIGKFLFGDTLSGLDDVNVTNEYIKALSFRL
jgi:nucleoside-diphosphate-sugar epimerase